MPKNFTLSKPLPAEIYNIGSSALEVTAFDREVVWERMDIAMGDKAARIPVFLVNEKQMDIVYPPQRRRVIPPQRIKELPKDRLEDPDFNISQLEGENNDWAEYKVVVAAGVYTNLDSNQDKMKVLKARSKKFQLLEEARKVYLEYVGPCIYLCGERIVRWAKSTGIPVELVLDKVYYHELGHALMDTYEGPSTGDPYGTTWGRVIEESAANGIAYRRFMGREARLVQKLISDQSAEYQGYIGLYHLIPISFPLTLPGRMDSSQQLDARKKLRAFFHKKDHAAVLPLLLQRFPIEYFELRWLPFWEWAIERIIQGKWTWKEALASLRLQGVPFFPPLGWGEGMLPAQVLSWGGSRLGSRRTYRAVEALQAYRGTHRPRIPPLPRRVGPLSPHCPSLNRPKDLVALTPLENPSFYPEPNISF